MIGRGSKVLSVGMQVLDMLIVTTVFFTLDSISGDLLPALPEPGIPNWFLPWILLIFHFCLRSFDLYQFSRLGFLFQPTGGIVTATAFATAITTSFLYLVRNAISRKFVVSFFICSAIALFLSRLFVKTIFRNLKVSPRRKKNLLIIGTNFRAEQFAEYVTQNPGWGYHIVGFADMDPARVGLTIEGAKVICTVDEVKDLIRKQQIDEVVISAPRSWLSKLEDVVFSCEEMGIIVHLIADFFKLLISRTNFEDFYGIPILSFTPPPERTLERIIKRSIDLIGSGLGLIVLSPFFLAVALLIKFSMPGPVFFGQERVGLHKRRFTCWKFRTMVVDAEQLKERLAAHNEMDGPVFKIAEDPRITQFGKFLRRFSIDEFPQLWNIFVGDMSLVGPRPPTPEEVDKYERSYMRRLSMRPGLTCVWQVSGRNLIGFADWMRMDLYYIDNWSIWLDLQILVQTIPVVLTGRGAS
ncbi:MAG: sugar transferase [Candidatus Riflebacteria bacterium]|nr:sugar transferase [Candidatus Riflebacteria bacterium]